MNNENAIRVVDAELVGTHNGGLLILKDDQGKSHVQQVSMGDLIRLQKQLRAWLDSRNDGKDLK